MDNKSHAIYKALEIIAVLNSLIFLFLCVGQQLSLSLPFSCPELGCASLHSALDWGQARNAKDLRSPIPLPAPLFTPIYHIIFIDLSELNARKSGKRLCCCVSYMAYGNINFHFTTVIV